MSERIVQSYDPSLAYYVNSVSDLNHEVVLAYKKKDVEKQKQLLNQGDKNHYDVFVCVDQGWHGFVLIVPCGEPSANLLYEGFMEDDPYKIPGKLFCRKFELRFENIKERMYKISKSVKVFEDIQKYTTKFYYIGRYADVPLPGLDLAALRAAPHRYETLLNDCVEFAKEYCDALLSYCSNGLKIEKEVKSNIKKATASGFTVEKLSRQSYVSGLMGNFSFGGADVTSFLAGRHGAVVLCILILFVLLWPIVVVILAKHYRFL